MNELQFPVLYIDDTANPHAILSFLCQSGYYCLILTDFLAEFETKCGRVYCDYIIRKTKNSSFKNEKSKKEVDVTITVSNKDIV